MLRRAAASLIRQLAQRAPDRLVQHSKDLDQQLFRMLDVEVSNNTVKLFPLILIRYLTRTMPKFKPNCARLWRH